MFFSSANIFARKLIRKEKSCPINILWLRLSQNYHSIVCPHRKPLPEALQKRSKKFKNINKDNKRFIVTELILSSRYNVILLYHPKQRYMSLNKESIHLGSVKANLKLIVPIHTNFGFGVKMIHFTHVHTSPGYATDIIKT